MTNVTSLNGAGNVRRSGISSKKSKFSFLSSSFSRLTRKASD